MEYVLFAQTGYGNHVHRVGLFSERSPLRGAWDAHTLFATSLDSLRPLVEVSCRNASGADFVATVRDGQPVIELRP